MTVKVAVRSRPLNDEEKESCVDINKEDKSVTVAREKLYKFDHVFGETTSNKDLYQECISTIVDDFTFGSNATVLAYGQTGSGKTYTMGTNYSKDSNLSESQVGIIPRVLKDLFEKVDDACVIEISFLEIYNEAIRDILSSNLQKVSLQEKKNAVKLTNLTSNRVSCLDDALKLLEIGSIARTTGATALNLNSSRSHAIFILNLTKFIGSRKITYKLHLVDLAGSEGVRKSKTEGERKREGININLGLLSLGKVISSLCSKNQGHIPYRDSVLTRMLKNSLNGTSLTLMISCINPDVSSIMETVDTLRYASGAINIPSVNVHHNSFMKENNPLRSKLDQIPPTPGTLRAFGSLPLLTSSTPASHSNNCHLGLFSPDGIGCFSVIKPSAPDLTVKPTTFAVPQLPPKFQMKQKQRFNNDFSGLISPLARKVHGMLEQTLIDRLDTMEKRTIMRKKRKSLEVLTNKSLSAKRRKEDRKATQILNDTFSPIKSPVKDVNSSTNKLNITFSPVDSSSLNNGKAKESDEDSQDTFDLILPAERPNRKKISTPSNENSKKTLNSKPDHHELEEMYSPLVKKVTKMMEDTIYPQIEKMLRKNSKQQASSRSSPRQQNLQKERFNNIVANQEHLLKSHESDILHIINYGSLKKLKSLPCIGEKTAQMIVTYRKIKGPLKKLQDLKTVVSQKSFVSRFLKANCLEMLIEKI